MAQVMTDININSNEIMDEVRLFFPFYDGSPKIELEHYTDDNEVYKITVNSTEFEYRYFAYTQKEVLTYAKIAVFRALSEFTGYKPPWGSLTGIRPTKLVYDFIEKKSSNNAAQLGTVDDQVIKYLTEKYLVSNKKALIISNIISNQQGFFSRNLNLVNLYIHIPFCPTKCSYCSFISLDAKKFNKLIEPYLEALIVEINETLSFLKAEGYGVYSVYVGGGTPTVLDNVQLQKLLSVIKEGLLDGVEFTVEAGRPDTITEEKLFIMQEYGVSRISINPQTFSDATLQRIGRAHSAQDVVDKFLIAQNKNFIINADLIAGLPGETLSDFQQTIDKALGLMPQNITVHTLARKNGSEYKLGKLAENSETEQMVDYAYARLTDSNYLPYYLYRQKSMMANLENIGYALAGTQCKNNVTVMEEMLSVVACGAGAISKRLFEGNRIERLANLRDVKLYLEQFNDRLSKKLAFFKK